MLSPYSIEGVSTSTPEATITPTASLGSLSVKCIVLLKIIIRGYFIQNPPRLYHSYPSLFLLQDQHQQLMSTIEMVTVMLSFAQW
jgi:hypothetical protein